MTERDPPTPRDIRTRLAGVDTTGHRDLWPSRVELAGVPGTELGDDGLPVEDDEETGEKGARDDADPITVPVHPTVEDDEETGENGARDDAPECETCGLNSAYPGLSGECEACAGMPRRDWREDVLDPDGEEGGDHE